MMSPEEILFKLGELQPPEIARLMKDSGVKALRACAESCAVTQYVYNETGLPWISTGTTDLHYGWKSTVVELPSTVQMFVRQFDEGVYPELDAMSPMNQEN